MVCYARPVSWLTAILTVTWLAFSGPVSHFFGTAAVLVAVIAVTAGAAVAAALTFATVMSTRRRRAAAGGCVSCQYRCQHAMTGPVRRFFLVTTADRRAAPGQPGSSGRASGGPGRSVPVLLPVPAVRLPDPGTPRWPDRPLHRTGQAARPAAHVPRHERAGSPALAGI
jgi:hypothetical protein